MTATRAEQADLRRQGIADAAVLLVAHRRFPNLELADWGEYLDLTQLELQAAVARFRAQAEALRPKPKPAPKTRHLRVAGDPEQRRYKGEKKPCPKGCGAMFVHSGRHTATCTGATT